MLATSSIKRSEVKDYRYYFKQWLDIETGNEQLRSYWYEAASFNRVDSEMTEGKTYHSYNEQSQVLVGGKQTNGLSYSVAEYGGPFYVEVGRDIQIENHDVPDQNRRL